MTYRDISASMVHRTVQWQSLAGAVVEVYLHDSLYRRGIVDDTMPDASGIWIAADGPSSREFIHKSSGYAVWTSLHPSSLL
jgi:hypothetical protein